MIVGGQNGTIATYDVSGSFVGTVASQARVDQCSLNALTHELAWAGDGMLSIVRDAPFGNPVVLGTTAVSRSAHTVGFSEKTDTAWLVWAQATGDFVQPFKLTP